MENRRAFLKFLAGSPLLTAIPSLAQGLLPGDIDKAADALDVFDLATGVDGEDTLKANREGFTRYQLRPRRFVDVSHIDMSVELFGMKLNSPLVLCPVGSQKAFHPEGEVAAAKAAQAKGNLQILSTQTSYAVED